MKNPSATRARSNSPCALGTTIVEAVADREGVRATDLSPPLHAAIDVDALTALFAPTHGGASRNEGRVEFEYCGYEIVVCGDGRVFVADEENESGPKSTTSNRIDERLR